MPIYGCASTGGGDPHFLVRLPGLNRPLCFEVECEPKTFLRILLDPVSGKLL